MSLATWMRGRKTTASVAALAVLIAAPVTVAVLHRGFPVTDVNLTALDVWVTNGAKAAAGRLNMQIKDLNGSVGLASQNLDVVQDGDAVFVYDELNATVQHIDPASTKLDQTITVDPGVQIAFGNASMAIIEPSDGTLWVIATGNQLSFDAKKTEPVGTYGAGARAVVTQSGIVFVASPSEGKLYRVESLGAPPVVMADVTIDDFELTAVGDRAVILDRDQNTLISDDGSVIRELDSPAVRIQQVSAAADSVVVATGDSLLRVGFDGSTETFDAKVGVPSSDPGKVTAPVALGECIHGAWTSAQRYLGVCEGRDPVVRDILEPTGGSELVFRVNRSVVVLNNLANGNVWLVTDQMELVDNWDEVAPSEQTEGEQGDEKISVESFDDTLAKRDPDINHAPEAADDAFGVRPGKTTILAVLDNDKDVDGDVLTVTRVSQIDGSAGRIDVIDGGRALQFVPAAATGAVSFSYTVSDGRAGGVDEATVTATIHPVSENAPPNAVRTSKVQVEAGQTVSYNVLGDWIDPDGDDLLLLSAASEAGDLVRFTPDGLVTFTHSSSELGAKKVTFTVSDGMPGSPPVAGELMVEVLALGELTPVATPDFAGSYVGESVDIPVLDNDRSPSGQPLYLSEVAPLSEGVIASVDASRGVVIATASAAGTYYLEYGIMAGTATTRGLIRVDVVERPTTPLAPIAVKDVAYAKPNQPVTLGVLANDVSRSGNVLVVQSVTLPREAEVLTVEVLNGTLVRITAPSGLTAPIDFSYTISDGLASATAGITVLPVPELTKHQTPIAVDDRMTVRAGDIASVAVLDNDYHPDGARMTLDTTLVDAELGFVDDPGIAFVTGDKVRIQAPQTPGPYSVAYRITDAFGEAATATVQVTVVAMEKDTNRPPVPRDLTARAFQDGTVTVSVPLDGIDPDGDSVTLVSVATPPQGTVVWSSEAFTYQAPRDFSGTVTFSYTVADTLGEQATGIIRLGVIERPDSTLPPVAVGDEVTMLPNRVAAVPVLLNDSDPTDYDFSLDTPLLEVQDGISAIVDGTNVIVTSAETSGTFVVRYSITNEKGLADDAFIRVTVDPLAAPKPPTAIDHIVESTQIQFEDSAVDVNVLDGAINPGGLPQDLVVTLEGPNAGLGKLVKGGVVRVALGTSRQAIAYRVTNEVDQLSATAFIVVPPLKISDPPRLRDDLPEQFIDMNGDRKTWKLSDILVVPSGRDARIITPDSIVAGGGAGTGAAVDEFTIGFTPSKNFRGKTIITFEVTDGSSASDKEGLKATISLPVTVGDAEFRDVAPEFADITVNIVEGEAPTTVDLRAATSHPNPDVLKQVSYSALTGQTPSVEAQLSESSVTLSAPFTANVGDEATLTFTYAYSDFVQTGTVTVRVVQSTRPLAETVDDIEPEGRSSTAYTIGPLDNDFNPFAAEGTELTLTDVQFEGDSLGAAVSQTGSMVTVTTGPAKSGTISLIYTVRDATDSAAREVTGRITVVVASAPDPVTTFTVTSPGSQQVSVTFQAPASNGAAITGYTVRVSGTPGQVERTDCLPGVACTFSGRTNGEVQTVTVAATNKIGTSWSSPRTVTPYGTPAAPASVSASDGPAGAGTVNLYWSATTDSGGGTATYQWRQLPSGGWNNAGTALSATPNIGVGNSASFAVRALNGIGTPSAETASNLATAPPPPPKVVSVTKGASLSSPYGPANYLQINVSGLSGTHRFCIDGMVISEGVWGPWSTNGAVGTDCFNATVSAGSVVNTNYYLASNNIGTYKVRISGPDFPTYEQTIW